MGKHRTNNCACGHRQQHLISGLLLHYQNVFNIRMQKKSKTGLIPSPPYSKNCRGNRGAINNSDTLTEFQDRGFGPRRSRPGEICRGNNVRLYLRAYIKIVTPKYKYSAGTFNMPTSYQ